MGANQVKLQLSHIVGTKVDVSSTYDSSKQFRNVPECLRYYATSRSSEEALVFCSTVAVRFAVSFKELYDRSLEMANAIKHLGVKAGETIVIVTRTCPEWYYTVIGAMMIRAYSVTTIVTYNDGHDVIQLMKTLQNGSCLVLDAGLNDSNWNILKTLLDEYNCNGHVSSSQMPNLRYLLFTSPPSMERVKTVASLVADHDELMEIPNIDPDELAVLFQTSASSGEPKLVAHSHRNILHSRDMLLGTGSFEEGQIRFNDRPFFWSSGFMWDALIGCKRVTTSGMCPEPVDKMKFIIDVINREKCTCCMMLPSMIYELMKYKEDLPSDWPLENIDTGGQPITRSITECLGYLCRRLLVQYGSTEFLLGTGSKVDDVSAFVDYSCGRPPFGVEVKVVDKDSAILPIGERGEIYIKSLWLFKEYYNDPKKTAEVKMPDGWYKTDDFGRLNTDGFLFVEGRVSDIILSGGKNVAPAILEAVLKSYPGVEDSAIVPVPDDVLFQTICACVKVKSRSEVSEANLRGFIDKMHMDKEDLFTALPKYYMILDTFPQGATGKLSRKILRQMAAERFYTK